jgi:hypothetical protein
MCTSEQKILRTFFFSDVQVEYTQQSVKFLQDDGGRSTVIELTTKRVHQLLFIFLFF